MKILFYTFFGSIYFSIAGEHVNDNKNIPIIDKSEFTENLSQIESENNYRVKNESDQEGTESSRKKEMTNKPRLLVLTDIGGDPDDIQSLRRLLVYSNEFRITGLIATATGRSRERLGIREDLIHNAINDYELVRDNLLLHTSGYPTAKELREVVRGGEANRGVDIISGHSTSGSQHIINVVDASDERVCIVIWGGAHDLAQALLDIKMTRTPDELNYFLSKIRVYAIADQDKISDAQGTGEWIRENFPGLKYVEAGPPWMVVMAASFRGMYQNESAGGDHPVLSLTKSGIEHLNNQNWVESNVLPWGPLGAGYPYNVNQNPNAPRNTKGVKEGDTPSWFYFLPNGLNNPEQPEWGGWGGRFQHHSGNHYTDAQDNHWSGNMDGSLRMKWTVARWREAFQNDFAARMRWCKLRFEEANHNPVAVINKDDSKDILVRNVVRGKKITLDATASYDPDGDTPSFNWWIYTEPSSSTGIIRKNNNPIVKIEIPESSPAGGDVHVILQVTDDGNPKLYSYRRVILKVMNP